VLDAVDDTCHDCHGSDESAEETEESSSDDDICIEELYKNR